MPWAVLILLNQRVWDDVVVRGLLAEARVVGLFQLSRSKQLLLL